MHSSLTIHLGVATAQIRRAARHLIEGVFAPLGLFYLLVTLTDLNGGIFAALGWGLAAVLMRVVTRARIPAVLLLTTGLLVVRSLLGYFSESTFLYFLQPSLQNFVLAAVLLATVPLRQPLIARLADDFCAFPPVLTEHPRVQRFFRRVSLLWAVVFVTNGATTLWVLVRATLDEYLLATVGSFSLVLLAILGSLLWFQRELRSVGIRLRFKPVPATS